MDFMDWDSYFVFHPKDLRSKIYVEVYDGIVSIVNLETRCSSSAASQIQWWATLLSRYYRWSLGIQHATMKYVLGAYFLFIELYVFPFAGNLTVTCSRVR